MMAQHGTSGSGIDRFTLWLGRFMVVLGIAAAIFGLATSEHRYLLLRGAVLAIIGYWFARRAGRRLRGEVVPPGSDRGAEGRRG